MDWDKVIVKKFLLKVAYLGTNYHGIAWQDDEIPTVDRELFRALKKTCLIKDRSDCEYSRCGRTDKGVHALSNFVALRMRVRADGEPLEYLTMLNRVLPKDIRILSAKEVPDKFDARHDCRGRVYRYFFTKTNDIDIDKMRQASQALIGTHDFRNFCKMDISQTTNHVRTIHSINFTKDENLPVYQVEIKGNAFLWNMVRSIMAILLAIGEGLEQESLVGSLLNLEICPRKPIYEIADPAGLVLYNCTYDESIMEGTESNDHALSAFTDALIKSYRDTAVLQAIVGVPPEHLRSVGRIKYTPILQRATAPSLDEKIQSEDVKRRKIETSLD